MTTTSPRERLLEAQALVSHALTLVDEAAPALPEPERASVVGLLGLRDEMAGVVRRLGSLAVFLGAAERESRPPPGSR